MKKFVKYSLLAPLVSLAFSQVTLASASNVCTDATGITSKTIGEIQGDSFISPLLSEGVYETEQEYRVTGVVSAIINSAVLLYDNDGVEATSDGLYIYLGSTSYPNVGDTICVKGVVKEYFGLTQVSATNKEWEMIDSSTTAPGAVDLKVSAADATFAVTLERHEGMLVNLPADMDELKEGYQDMRVARTFGYDYDAGRNNMVLSYSRINLHPNQVATAGSEEALAQRVQNEDFRLFLESDDRASNGEIPYYPNFQSNPEDNHVRVNDSIVGLQGVLIYTYDEYRLYVPDESSFNISSNEITHNSPRTTTPIISTLVDYDEFTLKIATQNVLNFFNSPFNGQQNIHGLDRGADSSDEFVRQTDKLVNTLYAMNADVVGLLEVENNGFGTFGAIKKIQDELNAQYYKDEADDRGDAKHIENQYAFVAVDANGDTLIDSQDDIGSDVVTTGMLYRPSMLTLESVNVIAMPAQHAPIIVDESGAAILDHKDEIRESGDNYQRDSLVATFIVHNTGKRISIAVNHLKSKGSTCWEDWQGWETWENFDPVNDDVQDLDFQGNCENFRVAAAVQLGEKMEKIKGDRILLGDMNAYTYEDPILVLTSNPTNKTIMAARDTYIGNAKQFGPEGKAITKTYGYVSAAALKDEEKGQLSWSFSFNDEVGSLDHMLISPSLETRLVDAVEWHINAAESTLFDYNEEFKGSNDRFYDVSPFRSSDHDSAIMTLRYQYAETDDEPVHISTHASRMVIPFIIPASLDAQVNDVAHLVVRGLEQEIATLAIPKVTLTQSGPQTVLFEVVNLHEGDYQIEMQLRKGPTVESDLEDTATEVDEVNESTLSTEIISAEGTLLTGSTVTMDIKVVKQSGLVAKAITPSYDQTGGGGPMGPSLFLGLLALIWTRKVNKQN